MDKTEDLIVEGYLFGSSADAAVAKEELKKISYIENKINYDDESSVLIIYKKMLANRVLVTPVGYAFLKKLQSYLNASPEIPKDEVMPIPLYSTYATNITGNSDETSIPKVRIKPKEGPDFKGKLKLAIFMNVIFAILVVVMFVITIRADNPNMINYKSALINKYASWEQELSERENVIREKERELFINSENK